MKESSRDSRGAEQLRRAVYAVVGSDIQKALGAFDADCDHLLRIGASSPIHLEKRGAMITLSKKVIRSDGSEFPEFTLKVRLDEKAEWWPTEFQASDGKKISAEIYSGGKRLTNIHVQSELVDIANTWGKSIASQKVAKDLEGTL